MSADLFGLSFEIVTPWERAKHNDILARYPDGQVEILVARRIKTKRDAEFIADCVEGRVMLDGTRGRMTWAVTRMESGVKQS